MGYWLHNPETARAAQEQFVRELATRVPDLKGKRVIDVGCGFADPAILLAYEHGAKVDGVNVVARQIDWPANVSKVMVSPIKVRVHLASAMDLPFPDRSFDVVFCLETAHCSWTSCEAQSGRGHSQSRSSVASGRWCRWVNRQAAA
jgi:27-O-demethylrifamycin SV methyltransferase